tara:strand:- start:304 stop:975 length:672 start_codon:yes stop_codon:yes gene_type:complete
MQKLKHIAIVPDGNRRWAKKKLLEKNEGHKKAAQYKRVIALLKAAKKEGIKIMTLWGFSTENWKRSAKEKKILFQIITKLLKELEIDVIKEKIEFKHLGRKDRIPKSLLEQIQNLEKISKNYKNFKVNLCIDYGGKDEIIRAVKKIKNPQKINENNFEKYLDTKDSPELIIRTGGEKRLSGLMPFQTTYSELYFTKKYFPDFSPKDLKKAIKEFFNRQRRFGK